MPACQPDGTLHPLPLRPGLARALPDHPLRLFFAVPLLAGLASRVESIAKPLSRTTGGRCTPAGQYHLTLAFLGEIAAGRRTELMTLATSLDWPAICLELDRTGSFGKDAGWLAPSQVPEPLVAAVQCLHRQLRLAGFHVERRRWRPHLTILRRLQIPLLPAVLEPPLPWPLERLQLLSSRLTPRGPRYTLEGELHWPHHGSLS
ncbi:RNA 2',3'-cyclic phosphodiesterase [Laribacter hongkongensis]|uniref:RNA 2',3'-cyclic phosphodiesterase n=1 Tax=Laribacter hongkongensis TaxID=168471 RepID=A0ABD4SV09_9NEIS|nr:RNA 2',3'-cyclic phosphodiesterase [Laribacter hongkongensis]MCG9026599.1 RNA 2',3'-cyclic phosphodiesterase [Laribacter hongkongensis]MCG9100896.1 RNA 2',3'-cyclic phosphodiesterase [Laribacter hongkongensis]MCG9103824.1 RNA 2',3'-cyclic phosphodiesterase [Laribacter hongkongensis]MCG9112661.1 RNA 2',3'-cyclic phosphodiesterase [Laribacter hongkongensis]MCG9118739.1 RNA 2',3'-cyclic phosphodiesterase [Laribacter hongkongensis]